jgi:hypothetical protein
VRSFPLPCTDLLQQGGPASYFSGAMEGKEGAPEENVGVTQQRYVDICKNFMYIYIYNILYTYIKRI